MFYYKQNGYLFSNSTPLVGLEEITEQEYNRIIESIKPTEEEIRAQKEAQLSQLLRELYPDEYKEEG